MQRITRGPRLWVTRVAFASVAAAALVALSAATAGAQVVRGRIISNQSRTPMADATVEALDTLRQVIAAARSDSAGSFVLLINSLSEFRIRIRRIGIEPTLTDALKFEGQDTVSVDLLVDEAPAMIEERRVTATMSQVTEERLRNARSRGWRVYPPDRVRPVRERALNLDAMLKALGLQSVMISQQCIRSLVTNGCMTVFVDDQYYGAIGFNSINVRDIEFVAVIGPTEALITYGNRAQHGVVMLYTSRMEDRRPRR